LIEFTCDNCGYSINFKSLNRKRLSQDKVFESAQRRLKVRQLETLINNYGKTWCLEINPRPIKNNPYIQLWCPDCGFRHIFYFKHNLTDTPL